MALGPFGPKDTLFYSTLSCVNGILKHPEVGASVGTIKYDALAGFVASLMPLNSEPWVVWSRGPATKHPC